MAIVGELLSSDRSSELYQKIYRSNFIKKSLFLPYLGLTLISANKILHCGFYCADRLPLECSESFVIYSTIHHQINENEINLTIRPRQENFFGEPSHATITIEVRLKFYEWIPQRPFCDVIDENIF